MGLNMTKLEVQDSTDYSNISQEKMRKELLISFLPFQGIEERHYQPAKWVSTKVQSMKYKEATSTGFWRLFKFIGGENEKGVDRIFMFLFSFS